MIDECVFEIFRILECVHICISALHSQRPPEWHFAKHILHFTFCNFWTTNFTLFSFHKTLCTTVVQNKHFEQLQCKIYFSAANGPPSGGLIKSKLQRAKLEFGRWTTQKEGNSKCQIWQQTKINKKHILTISYFLSSRQDCHLNIQEKLFWYKESRCLPRKPSS